MKILKFQHRNHETDFGKKGMEILPFPSLLDT